MEGNQQNYSLTILQYNVAGFTGNHNLPKLNSAFRHLVMDENQNVSHRRERKFAKNRYLKRVSINTLNRQKSVKIARHRPRLSAPDGLLCDRFSSMALEGGLPPERSKSDRNRPLLKIETDIDTVDAGPENDDVFTSPVIYPSHPEASFVINTAHNASATEDQLQSSSRTSKMESRLARLSKSSSENAQGYSSRKHKKRGGLDSTTDTKPKTRNISVCSAPGVDLFKLLDFLELRCHLSANLAADDADTPQRKVSAAEVYSRGEGTATSRSGGFDRFRPVRLKPVEAFLKEAGEIQPFHYPIPPLVRFRQSVQKVILLQRAVSRRTDHIKEYKLLSFSQLKDELTQENRQYGNGLTFNPGEYKAHKEVYISNEAKAILRMNSDLRTEEQIHTVLASLNTAVQAFSEFPINMQKSLAKVGWYNEFDAKRVIIRQGHKADNFYFILTGTAVVTLLQTNPKTGEISVRTLALLGKGNSFGELALMRGATRSATVTCQNAVELLAVGRQDFIDIFMHVELNKEPEHIKFLRQVDILREWPIDQLPRDDPKICLFTYFRRGVVMCRDSNNSEWIYIIKTGSCRVLKSLYATEPDLPGLVQLTYNTVPQAKQYVAPQVIKSARKATTEPDVLNPSVYGSKMTSPRSNKPPDRLPPIYERTDEEVRATIEEHQKRLEEIFQKQHEEPKRKNSDKDSLKDAGKKKRMIFVQLQILGPKDTFGLDVVAFSMMEKCTSVSLVSDGTEAILINKKYFLQYLTDRMCKVLRTTVQPYPTEEDLQQKLQDQTNWDAFKSMTVTDFVSFNKYVQDTLNL